MKQKNLSLSLFLVVALLPTLAYGQKEGGWAVGLGFQPFLYWKYNKSDWNNRPTSYPVSPKRFNGWAGALTIARSVADNWGIGAELSFSRQKQRYNTSNGGVEEPNGSTTYYYALGSFTRLDYLKIPIYACYRLELGYESGLFLQMIGGPQFSLNTDYYSEFKQFEFDGINRKYLLDDVTNTMITTPCNFYQNYVNFDGSHDIHGMATKYLFRRFELGVVGGLALQSRIFQYYKVQFGIRYELGLSDMENPKVDKNFVTFSGGTGSDGLPDPRPSTHNRRLVLDIGFSRIIE